MHDPAILRRLFALAAQRAGGKAALVRYLGIPYSELKTYAAGEVMPPRDTLFRMLELVPEDLELLKREFPETWTALPLRTGGFLS